MNAPAPTHSTTVGGSSCGRLIQCPGSYRLLKEIRAAVPGEAQAGVAAERGTALHEAIAAILEDRFGNAADVIGLSFNAREISEDDFRDAVKPALDEFDALADLSEAEGGLEYMVETSVAFPGIPHSFGTADIIARTNRRTFVMDWKFGYNPVEAEKNPQGQFYACGALKTHPAMFGPGDDWPVEICIIQPQSDPVLKRWSTTIAELAEFQESLIRKYGEANGDNPTFAKGKECQYCDAKPICPEYGALRADLPEIRHEIELVKTSIADPVCTADINIGEFLATLLEDLDDLEDLKKSVHALATQYAHNGPNAVPGHKLIEKLSNSFWVDKAKTQKWLRTSMRLKFDQIAPRNMISPSAVGKLLKDRKGRIKEVPADQVGRVVTGVALVKDSAKGDAWLPGSDVNALAAALPDSEKAPEINP